MAEKKYDRKIIYLDYLERGNKIKNGGVIKWEMRGNDSRLQIHIRGLYATDTLQAPLYLCKGDMEYAAEQIGLQFGAGETLVNWDSDNLAGSYISGEDLEEIIIRISDTRMLVGKLRERSREINEPIAEDVIAGAVVARDVVVTDTVAEDSVTEDAVLEDHTLQSQEISDVYQDTFLEQEPMAEEAAEVPEGASSVMQEPVTEEPATWGENLQDKDSGNAVTLEEQPAKFAKLSPNKWMQLNRLYQKIQPFGDARVYLSITPGDFVILTEKYQNLVQNSFLLHGYYNYGHVILTKIREKEAENYYIGVPGVYYEREKQAALMFGFEGFEGGGDSVADGSFGYYMKQVEI